MAFNSFRMFLWKVNGKPPLSDEELISIIEKYITPDAFGTLTGKQTKQLTKIISCIAEINSTNTLRLLQEYHEWQQH